MLNKIRYYYLKKLIGFISLLYMYTFGLDLACCVRAWQHNTLSPGQSGAGCTEESGQLCCCHPLLHCPPSFPLHVSLSPVHLVSWGCDFYWIMDLTQNSGFIIIMLSHKYLIFPILWPLAFYHKLDKQLETKYYFSVRPSETQHES